MKKLVKSILYLQMTALLLTSALAGPKAVDKERHIGGIIEGVEIADVQFPSLFVDGTGSGKANLLGRFTMTYELEVNLLTLPFQTIGSAVFSAANGDTLFTEITGLGTPTEPGFDSIVEIHTITGGSGRFAGATGSFRREYLLNIVTGITGGSFEGTIVTDKEEHNDK